LSTLLANLVAISVEIGQNMADLATIDDLDLKLIKLLQKDARLSSEALAAELFVSATTVRRRIRELTKNKILRVVALVDLDKMGFPYRVIIGVKATGGKLDSIRESLEAREEIKWVVVCTGRFDVLAFGRFRNTDEVSQFLQKYVYSIEGVATSETFVCLTTNKGRYTQV